MRRYWERLDVRSRARILALGGSVTVHLLAILTLTPWIHARIAGAAGPTFGSGLNLVLVSEASAGTASPQPPPMDATVDTSKPSPPPVLAQADLSEGGAMVETPAPAQTATSTSVPDSVRHVVWQADGSSRLQAQDDHEQRGAKDMAGGDPTAESELLSQIARCLPAGLRPKLPTQRLVLRVGANGRLAAAPIIDSVIPILTAEDRAAADKVVQAALQCGPYTASEALGQEVSLAVDFSVVHAAEVADSGSPRGAH